MFPLFCSPVQLGNEDESEGCRVVMAVRVKVACMWCVYVGGGCLYIHACVHACKYIERSMFNPRD